MLSDSSIRKAKPAERQYKLPDERGLHLLVRPTGSKLWQVRYRHDGREKTASLGAYPEVTLSEAREKREALRKQVAAGIDPVQAKREGKTAALVAAEHSFEAVARMWWLHWKASRSDSHVQYVIRRLEQNVFPEFGTVPVSEIEAPALVAMVKKVAQRGALDIAKRCLQMCSQVFRYAIAHGMAKRNPAADIMPSDILPARRRANYARVDAAELPTLLRKIEAYPGTPVTRLAMKFMALTFVRTGELIGARWAELDLEAARWDIPAERMKMKTPHVVPLAHQAVDVLRTLKEISGHREYVFPGERNPCKTMSNNTILAALERMGYAGRMTGHGFRGVASTLLHEHGFDHAHIELQLAHTERNAISAAYNHALYLPQRAEMMAWWADHLDGLVRGNVLPMRRLAA